MVNVKRNDAQSRYEIFVDEELAGIADYQLSGDTVVFLHTEIKNEFGGRGLGTQLVKYAVEDVTAEGKNIDPKCPFVANYLKKHKIEDQA